MNAQDAIKAIAEQDGITEEQVLQELRNAIDEAWENQTVLQAAMFPEGKPDPVTFLERIAKSLR
jgi:hypothetical protein